jgi:hypothetical protein
MIIFFIRIFKRNIRIEGLKRKFGAAKALHQQNFRLNLGTTDA